MDFEVFCDESCQELFQTGPDQQRQFVLLGSLWIEASQRPRFKQQIADLREQHKVGGEAKWTRISSSRQDFYTALVQLFFAEKQMRFRCIALKADEMQAVPFHGGDVELMFYKFYYQLLHHWILDCNRYSFFLDTKTNRIPGRLRKLHEVLSNANRLSEIVNMQALPSREVDLLQLTDVLLGAVGYALHRHAGSQAKAAVVQEIETALGHPIRPTPKSEEKFNVFRFRPGGGW
ncbi:MAG: DUF3800 domain-containing protein [Phycisphaerae bacterium]|nr:DUF3800 domain-containing protein [Phycisphaerae bacterium]